MDEAQAKSRMLDPDLPRKRKQAVKLLEAAIEPVAAAHGHMRTAAGQWSRQSSWCDSRVWLQKSSAGFACYLNIEYAARLGPVLGPVRSARIGTFAATTADANRLDALYYVEFGEVSPLRDEIMDLLARRAMPWLDRCHSLAGLPQRNHVPFGLMPP